MFRLSGHAEKWVLRPPWATATSRSSPGCIMWVGATSTDRKTGDVRARVGKTKPFRLLMGSPPGKEVCHSCDHGLCVSPDHLWLGTRSQNAMDSVIKGRHPQARKTSCPRGHGYSPENTRRDSKGYRKCLECERTRW